MRIKRTQLYAGILLAAFIALIYLINLFGFTLNERAQLIVGGLVLIALGALWSYLLGGPETLVCDRGGNTCQITKPRFLLQAKRVVEIPLTSIVEVSVVEVSLPSHDGPASRGYEVVLRGRDEASWSFSTEYSERRARTVVDRVKVFLKTTDRSSLVIRRWTWWMICIGVSGIGTGVLLI